MTSLSPVISWIMALIKVDLPTLVTPTTYTSRPLRQCSILSIKSLMACLFWAEVRMTSTGRRPSSWARSVSHWVTLPSLTDLGRMSFLFPTKSTSFPATKRGRPGMTEPLKSKISTTLTTKASLSPTSWRSRRKSSSVSWTSLISL